MGEPGWRDRPGKDPTAKAWRWGTGALLHRADTAVYRAEQNRTTGYAAHTPDDDVVRAA